MRTWIIGSGRECDLVVEQPTVSRCHCRLTRLESGDFVEDLGSSNGTFVNGAQIRSSTRVERSDTITLGLTVPMPWPDEPALAEIAPASLPSLVFDNTSTVIGRNADCDRMIDLPMISSRHARLTPKADRIVIEDLGSSNGTFVNGRRIDREATVVNGDTIGLGSHAMILAVRPRVIASTELPELSNDDSTKQPLIPSNTAPSLTAIGRNPTTWTGLTRIGRLIALVVHALALSLAIVIIPFANSSDLLFWVSLAAVWLGISTAIIVTLLDSTKARDASISERLFPLLPPSLLAVLVCGLQSLLFWTVIELGAGLEAPALPTLGIIVLAASVGLTFGLLVVSLGLNPPARWAVVAVAVVFLWLFGRGPHSREWLPSWTGIVSNTVPTRWAFEGLLLLEADAHQDRGSSAENAGQTLHQRADTLFPTESERMGPRAAALALGAMLVGLLCASAFISYDSRVRRGTS